MTTPAPIRILAVDDHPLFRQGLAATVRIHPGMLLVAEASSGREAIQRFRETMPDVTLMDARLPDMSGIDAMIAIREEFPEARFVVLTSFCGDVEIQRALAMGARAYVLKTTAPGELLQVIHDVHAGKKRIPSEIAARLAEHLSDEPLTVREVEILGQLPGGNRNRDIAEKLFIAEETVKIHVKHIMAKLGASDRTHAFAIGLQRGIIQI